jgi:hypothetical protein
MDTLVQVKAWLVAQKQLEWRIDGEHITVEPSSPEGFSVWITGNSREWIVGFDGWHEHFDTEAEAVHCFIWGLSGKCRLSVNFRGRFPYKWTVEYEEGGEWRSLGTTGLLVFPFWRRKRSKYLQNIPIHVK